MNRLFLVVALLLLALAAVPHPRPAAAQSVVFGGPTIAVTPGPCSPYTLYAPYGGYAPWEPPAATLYGTLRRSYPNARIVALGYPYLLPGGRAGLQPNDCASILRRYSLVERTGIRALSDQFDNALYEQAVVSHIEFVSPVAVWAVGVVVSVTRTVKVEVAVAVGVPEITPAEERLRPWGSVPVASAHV